MEASMGSLLSKLGGLLANEYALIRGLRGDIQYINDELFSMQAFLGDASIVTHDQDCRMKDWMKQIREVTHDIEDCIDDFRQRLSHDPGGDIFCAFVVARIYEVLTWWPRRNIASRIFELKVRAQQIGERRRRYGVANPKSRDGSSGGAATGFEAAENQQTSLQLVGTKMPVGVEEAMEELGKWLRVITEETKAPIQAQQSQDDSMKTLQESVLFLRNRPRHRYFPPVLSIVGFGGVGKTTIATALYRQFGDRFDRRAMVTVCQSSDHEAILRSILIQVMPLSDHDCEQQGSGGGGGSEKNRLVAAIGSILGHRDNEPRSGTSEKKHVNIQKLKPEELTKELENQLRENSYLLLIDDVWSATTWEQITKSLPKSKKCSRIIVTTRFQAVASTCKKDKGDYIHKVGVLCEEKAKKLFEEVIRESKITNSRKKERKIPPSLWEICEGVPLAIVTMAGHAACNPERYHKEWRALCTTLVPDSVKVPIQDKVMRMLSHCCNDMPADIKTCSLYLSIFPKGRIISRKRLIRGWIAEDFVSDKQGLSVEDVAEAYFNHLMRRKMIRPVEHSSNGKVKSYQVHDMILEYIISKAREENFVTVVGRHWLIPPSSKVRRLSLQGGDSKNENATESMDLSHVRSLTMFGSLTQLPFNSFKFGIVQVLDLEGCKDFKQRHTKEICKMLLLKHLNLRKTDIKKLPKKIGNLRCLETLDIRETNVAELPKTVCQLERVMNILGGNKRTRRALKLPEDLKKKTMKALRILSGIEIVQEPNAVADLHHLTDLRKLAIYKLNIKKGDKLFEDLRSSIEYLGGYSLHTLVIDDESSDFLESLGALSSPPRFLNALELSGKLVELPKWITELDALTKLTLSVTALRTDALEHLRQLTTLFSLTFSLTAAKQDAETATILEENKEHTDGEIIVPAGGFANLKLLRFSAPVVPKLKFREGAMPNLERLELRFSVLEGLDGIKNLGSLKEVHLRVHDKAGKATKSIVRNMATAARKADKDPRIIVDQYHE